MSFTLKTTMTIVLQESPTEGYPPMVLPFEKRLEDAHPHARMGGGVIPPGAQNAKVDFPGLTTLRTLWFYPEAAMSVLIGAANGEAVVVEAGGCVGFTHGSLPAANALRITYTGTAPGGYCVVYGGN